MNDAAEPVENNNPEERAAVEIAAETLGADLLQAMVSELMGAKVAWNDLSEADQNVSIERLRQRVHKLVGDALKIVLLQEYPTVLATVAGVRFQKGIRVMLAVDKHAHARHELADAEGQSVLVLIANPDELREGMSKIRARAKQGDLFTGATGVATGENYTGGDGRPYRRDEPGMGEAPTAGDLELAPDPLQPHPFQQDTDNPKLCRCGKMLEDAVHPAPQAPADIELERDPLWKQARDALAGIGIDVDVEIAKAWSEEQCVAAMHYYNSVDGAPPEDIPARPQFLMDKHIRVSKRRRRGEADAGTAATPDDTQ